MSARVYFAALAAIGVLLLLLTALGAHWLWVPDLGRVAYTMLAAGVPLAAAVWVARRGEAIADAATQKRALLLILVAAGLMRLILLPAPPNSTDLYRYIWDGRVQAAGINPYAYLPADEALRQLRDPDIFSRINRVDTAPTIYPPVAQVVFFLVTRLSETVWAMKLAMVAFDGLAMGLILMLLQRKGLPLTRIVLYAWHPLVVFEFAGSGHIDAVAIAFMLLACVAAYGRSGAAPGVALAAGTLAKFFPLVIAPALYRRWDWKAPAAGLATLVAGYALYIGVGWQVLGYLPGYAQEESLMTGSGFFVLSAIERITPLPSWALAAYLSASGLVLVALAIAAMLRRGGQEPSLGWALILIGTFTLILSPHLPWYFTWLLPFLCLVPSKAGLYLTLAAPIIYTETGITEALVRWTIVYAPFLLLLVFELVRRWQQRWNPS